MNNRILVLTLIMLAMPIAYAESRVEITTNATGDQQLIPSGSADWLGQTFLYRGVSGRMPTEVNITLAYATSDLTSCTLWLMNTTSQSSSSQMSGGLVNATLSDCSGDPGTILKFNLTNSSVNSGFMFTTNTYYGISITSEGGTGSAYIQQCSVNSPGCYDEGKWWQGTDNPPTGTSDGLDLDMVLYSELLPSSSIPRFSNVNCTSCDPPGGDVVAPYTTPDTTPTFSIFTDVGARCRIGSALQNYTAMNSTRQCTGGENVLYHTCTLTSQDEIQTTPSNVYISCAANGNESMMNTTDALVVEIPNNDTLKAGSVNTTNILDGTILGDDINPNTNITINRLQATTVNASNIILGVEAVTNSCSSSGCTATATCSSGKRVMMGFTATNSASCTTNPMLCNGYCVPGQTSCSITENDVVDQASVYTVCGKIS